MSDEVKRLCDLIIGHVADGKTIFEKDHAAMIDTMRSQQAEIERLREALAGVMDYAEEGALTIDTQPALDAAYAALGATQ